MGELQEGLLLVTMPNSVVPGNTMDTLLKVRETQHWLRERMEPQLQQMQQLLVANQQALMNCMHKSTPPNPFWSCGLSDESNTVANDEPNLVSCTLSDKSNAVATDEPNLVERIL